MGNTKSTESGKQPGSTAKEEQKEQKDDEKECETLRKLDVAFILDCTGSMNPYIESCKDNIISISSKINEECTNCDVQFALVSYRDIPPQDTSFITKIVDFTAIPFQIQMELQSLFAKGGGDQPEALTSALYACYKNLKWRQKSIKIIIVITDAPPHGLEVNIADGFPNGDPDIYHDTFNHQQIEGDKSVPEETKIKYLNIIDVVKSIRDDLNAVIYTVGCEPDLSCNNDFATDFMQYIAEFTKGKFLPLSSAKLLPEVIVGSVKQQINLDLLSSKLEEEIKTIKQKHGDISNAELNKIIMAKWKDEGIKKKEISIGTLYRNQRSRENINLLMNEQVIKSLSDFQQKCKLLPRLQQSDFRHLNISDKTCCNVDDTVDISDEKGAVIPLILSDDVNEATNSAPMLMLEVTPLTSEMLQSAKPAEKKRLIGERLFPKIQVVEPRLAGKITGMLLEMDNSELLLLLSDQRELMNQINEALSVLKDHGYQRKYSLSRSCSEQRVYSREASLSYGDMEDVMHRLNINADDQM